MIPPRAVSQLDQTLGKLRPKLIWAWVAYLFSGFFLMKTGMSDFWSYSHGGWMAFLIAWVIMTTMAWQWKVFGNPRKLGNVVGHLLMCGSLFLLFCRLTTRVPDAQWTLLGSAAKVLDWVNSLLGLFPDGAFRVLQSPGIMLTFVVVMIGMSLRERIWAVAFVGTAILLSSVAAVAGSNFGDRGTFMVGVVCLAAGLFLQFNDFYRRNFWEKVVNALKDDDVPRGDLELKYRILERLLDRTPSLSESKFRGLIARATGKPGDSPEVNALGRHVYSELAHADDLVETIQAPSGERCLVLNPDLLNEPWDVFSAVATVPKIAGTILVCLLWIVSPIDLIPDTIPVFGVLDDASISVLGYFTARRGLQSTKGESHDGETTLFRGR